MYKAEDMSYIQDQKMCYRVDELFAGELKPMTLAMLAR